MRLPLLIRFAFLLAGSLAAGLLPAARESAPASGEPATVPWLAELRATQARPTEASSFLRHVTPGRDGWTTEKYDAEIETRLQELSDALTTGPREPEELAGFVHPTFQGTPLRPAHRTRLREDSLVVEQLEFSKAPTMAAESFPEELAQFVAHGARPERVKFKVIDIRVESEEPLRVQTRLWYDLVARKEAGGVVQQNGHWRVTWAQSPAGAWQLRRLVAEPAWHVQSSRPFFTEITGAALREEPVRRQLARGNEYWTLNLDRALQTDIGGHNGLAVADVNGDGREDFYLGQPAGLPNRLFVSNKDGTFRETAAEAGVDVLDRTAGTLFFDYDNDGDSDLFLVTLNGPLLFENNGEGRFRLLDGQQRGLIEPGQHFQDPISACASDYNRDGWLDVYVTSYLLVFFQEKEEVNWPLPYHDAENGPPNLFYENNGDGTFREVSEETGLDQNNNRFSFACGWGDYNRDGWPDLYVANDFGRNNLYRNNGDGTFRDVAAEAGVEDIGAGMSVAWTDYDQDGWLDLYVGNMWSSAGLRVAGQARFKPDSSDEIRSLYRRHAKGNSLFRNRGDGTFEDVSEKARVTLGRWAWGSEFFDFDRDGHEDIYIVNGFLTNESEQDL